MLAYRFSQVGVCGDVEARGGANGSDILSQELEWP